jgi:ABC-type lipoprotein export system ATPase subunit
MDDTHNKIYNFHIIDNKSPIYDTYCEIINDLESDKSIFITGHAGSGKSTMLRNVMKYFYDKKIPYEKCAYTGIAA